MSPGSAYTILIVLFLGCNNPLAFQQHDETFRYTHYSSMVWPWLRWVTPFGNQQGDSLVTKGVTLHILPLIAKFMGPSWGPPGAARTQVGPMLVTWTLLSRTLHTYSIATVKWTIIDIGRAGNSFISLLLMGSYFHGNNVLWLLCE